MYFNDVINLSESRRGNIIIIIILLTMEVNLINIFCFQVGCVTFQLNAF